MEAMKNAAPNIRGNYPLAGERVGPAWRACWSLLSRTTWTDGTTLAGEVGPPNGLAPETVVNLLRQARQAGLLEVRMVRVGSRQRGEYRVKSQVDAS